MAKKTTERSAFLMPIKEEYVCPDSNLYLFRWGSLCTYLLLRFQELYWRQQAPGRVNQARQVEEKKSDGYSENHVQQSSKWCVWQKNSTSNQVQSPNERRGTHLWSTDLVLCIFRIVVAKSSAESFICKSH